MKKMVIIFFIVLVVGGFLFFISRGSRFQKTNIIENIAKVTQDDANADTDENDSGEEEINYYEAPKIEVKPADCNNNCANFKKAEENEYCRIICGTETFFEDASEEGGSTEDCDEEKDVQKDYCLKDIAIGNKDTAVCGQISDSNIKKSCQNRLIEDFLENQKLIESQDY